MRFFELAAGRARRKVREGKLFAPPSSAGSSLGMFFLRYRCHGVILRNQKAKNNVSTTAKSKINWGRLPQAAGRRILLALDIVPGDL